jgi:hypothetical protein
LYDNNIERIGVPPSIINITSSVHKLCPSHLKRMINLHNPKYHSIDTRKIPMIVHQHAHERCLARSVYK